MKLNQRIFCTFPSLFQFSITVSIRHRSNENESWRHAYLSVREVEPESLDWISRYCSRHSHFKVNSIVINIQIWRSSCRNLHKKLNIFQNKRVSKKESSFLCELRQFLSFASFKTTAYMRKFGVFKKFLKIEKFHRELHQPLTNQKPSIVMYQQPTPTIIIKRKIL